LKRISSSFSIIKDDLILRDLLRNQITHLHLALAREKDNAETVTNTFTLTLSLGERLTELEFTYTLPGQRWRTSPVLLMGKSFHSSTLTKLKINVATIYDCLLLLDGRLDSLSRLTINVADIFDAAIDILQEVSSRQRSSQWSFAFFSLERTSEIEIFLTHVISAHRRLRHSDCSIASSNDQS
jgi:hypothetical protein